MPYYNHIHTDDISPTRALARSLLQEALSSRLLATFPVPLPPPLTSQALPPPVTRQAVRRLLGRTVYWTRARILETMQGFVARCHRLPAHSDWLHAGTLALPARETVIRHFGSMEALREALAAKEEGG